MQLNRCTQCLYGNTAFHQVNSIGHDNPDLFIVGDYPRQEDDTTGYPMTGNKYKFLWDVLGQVGVKYRVGYTMRCLPVDPYKRMLKKPETIEALNCYKTHLLQELETLKPKAVILLGQLPVDVFFGEGHKVNDYRGYARNYTLPSGHVVKVMATYHPNYVISKGDDMFFNRFIEDIVYACRHAMAYLSEGLYHTKTVSADMFEKIVDLWMQNPEYEYVVYDTETNGLDPLSKGAKITSFSVSVDGRVGINVYLYHPEHPDITDLDRQKIIQSAKRLLTGKKVIAHHAKHEHRYTKVCFRFTPNIVDDTMYMAYILYMSYPGILYNLKFLSGRFLAMPPWEDVIDRYVELFKQLKRYKSLDDDRIDVVRESYEDVGVTTDDILRFWDILHDPSYYIKHEKSDQGEDVFMWMIPSRVLESYAGMDALAPFHLHKIFKKMIDSDPELSKAYRLLMKGADAFANIELKGCRIHQLDEWTQRYEEEIDKSLKEIRKYSEIKQFETATGQEFNPNSAKQNVEVFFTYFGFPVQGTTGKGDPSTSETNIIELIKMYEKATDPADQRKLGFLLAYRRYKKLKKLLSSYFVGLRQYIEPNNAFDGHTCEYLPVPTGLKEPHIHPQYKLHGTECVIAGTLVLTSDGEVPIEKLCGTPLVEKGFYPVKDVEVFDGDVWRKPLAFYYGGTRVVYEVVTQDGGQIVGTPEHMLYSPRGWVEIEDIRLGDKLVRYVDGVISLETVIEKRKYGEERVYDLSMDEAGSDFYER